MFDDFIGCCVSLFIGFMVILAIAIIGLLGLALYQELSADYEFQKNIIVSVDSKSYTPDTIVVQPVAMGQYSGCTTSGSPEQYIVLVKYKDLVEPIESKRLYSSCKVGDLLKIQYWKKTYFTGDIKYFFKEIKGNTCFRRALNLMAPRD